MKKVIAKKGKGILTQLDNNLFLVSLNMGTHIHNFQTITADSEQQAIQEFQKLIK